MFKIMGMEGYENGHVPPPPTLTLRGYFLLANGQGRNG